MQWKFLWRQRRGSKTGEIAPLKLQTKIRSRWHSLTGWQAIRRYLKFNVPARTAKQRGRASDADHGPTGKNGEGAAITGDRRWQAEDNQGRKRSNEITLTRFDRTVRRQVK